MFQDPNLPDGVTNAMCEPEDPQCATCGCPWSNHYGDDDDCGYPETKILNADQDFEHNAIELDSNGQVVHACDSNLGNKDKIIQCSCEGFIEGEYEPDNYDEDD